MPPAERSSYFTSGRFIHEDLAKKAAQLAEEARQVWKVAQKLEGHVVSWPSSTLVDDDGVAISHAVLMRVPSDFTQEQLLEATRRLVTRINAYGVALVLHAGQALRVLFETRHGALAWTIPLERHGDLLVPGETQQEETQGLGLLYLRKSGQ